MEKTKPSFFFFVLLILLTLGACRPGGQDSPTPTEPEPEGVKTAAAQTAEAGLTAQALTLAVPTATPTPEPPTETPSGPTETPTPVLTATQTPVPNAGGQDAVTFVLDVTVPDGTNFKAGESFTKTWRLQNAGSSTWTPDYKLVFVSGEQMGGPASVSLGQNVASGATVDLSVDLVAPATSGLKTGFWMLQNAAGQNFGIGPANDQAFYVQINVTGGDDGGGDGGPTPTITPTSQGGGGDGDAVTGVTLSVDESSFTGTCPHTFTFTAQVATNQATRITLEIEAGADDPSYQYNLPGPQTFDVGAGTFNYTYTLNLSNSVNGWARVRVTAPNQLASNQVNFSLVCQ